MIRRRQRRSFEQWLVLAVPGIWLVALVLVPFLIVLKISLSETAIAQPPYVPVLDLSGGWKELRDFVSALSFDNYARLGDRLYLDSMMRSVQIALFSTSLLLLIGYPIAYGIARAPRRAQTILVMLVVLPFLTAYLIRVYAWMNILQPDGLLNGVLIALGIVRVPVDWLPSDSAIYIGIVYSYLPFMVLPLYAVLERMDPSLLEAAADLGCPRWKAFWRVTLPLSLPGVAAGVVLCFIPIVGEFVIPELLGGSDSPMIGQTLWSEFFANRDWPVASAVAIAILVLLLVPIVVHQHLHMHGIERRG